MDTSVLDHIKLTSFPDDQFIKEETEKDTIYIHHTAGGPGASEAIEYWESNPEHIATSFIIAGTPPANVELWKDGQIYQCFNSKYWAWHLGGGGMLAPYRTKGALAASTLNKKSIGIELCNYGPLKMKADGSFITVATGSRIASSRVLDLGREYRGYRYWEAYTDAQIASLKELLVFLCEKWNIPAGYKGDEMFDISARAFRGEPGIWTHTSVRGDKYDCSPQPKLIEMLKSLEESHG